MRQEAKLSKQFMDAFERYAKSEVCVHKVSDTPVSYGQGDSRQQFSNPRAVDYIGVWRGRGLAIEFKYEKGTSMAFSKVRDDQKKFLTEFANAGGIALVAIFWDYIAVHPGIEAPPHVLEVYDARKFFQIAGSSQKKSMQHMHRRNYALVETIEPGMPIHKNQRNNQSWDFLSFERFLESQPEYKREPF